METSLAALDRAPVIGGGRPKSAGVICRVLRRAWTSRLPGACWVLTLGERARLMLVVDFMPRAVAKLLAIDELISLAGMRRGIWAEAALAGVRLALVRSESCFDARSSATAADVLIVFSELLSTRGFSLGNFSSCDSFLWWCSSSFSVRSASALVVPSAAFANSPAAWACSLTATTVSAVCVAVEAARA